MGAVESILTWLLIASVMFLFLLAAAFSKKTCPYCRARIERKAIVCPRCTRDIPRAPTKAY